MAVKEAIKTLHSDERRKVEKPSDVEFKLDTDNVKCKIPNPNE